jgi:hypothetical protein
MNKQHVVLYRKMSCRAGMVAFPAIFLISAVLDYLVLKIGSCVFYDFFFDHIWHVEIVWVCLTVCAGVVSFFRLRFDHQYIYEELKIYKRRLLKDMRRLTAPDSLAISRRYREKVRNRLLLVENLLEDYRMGFMNISKHVHSA